MPGTLCEAHPSEQIHGPGFVFILDPAGDHGRKKDVFQHGALRQQVMVLEHEPDLLVSEAGELFLGQAEGVDVPKQHRAGVGRLQGPEYMQQGALADPGLPNNRDTLSLTNNKVQAGKNPDNVLALSILFAELHSLE